MDYVEAATTAERAREDGTCVFCRLAASGPPAAETGVLARADGVFTVLNRYPYASGHLLVVPERHVAELAELGREEGAALWDALRTAVAGIERAYQPDGVNVGANLGRAAGAGIPRHLHLHVVPRWSGDTNFMTTVAGVRVLPQSLLDSWRALSARWPDPAQEPQGTTS
jgi:ATP adenylyltransferase